MEELCSYDSSMIVGILGGSAGTTHDAFHLLHEAKNHGARAALFGRKINCAECQLTFVEHLRRIADDQLDPKEAVKSYHAALQTLALKPQRPLAKDLQLTVNYSAYGAPAAKKTASRTAGKKKVNIA